jgi:hypothetical protein
MRQRERKGKARQGEEGSWSGGLGGARDDPANEAKGEITLPKQPLEVLWSEPLSHHPFLTEIITALFFDFFYSDMTERQDQGLKLGHYRIKSAQNRGSYSRVKCGTDGRFDPLATNSIRLLLK